MPEFDSEFLSRTEMLLGEEGVKRLGEARVAIFGVGGVGGYALEALVRAGVGSITLVDSDTVCRSNLNRQIIATEKTVGLYKTDAARARCESINPNVKIDVARVFFCEESSSEFDFSRYTYVIDAIDTVGAKCHLIEKVKASGTPIISSMGTGGKLDPTKFEVSDIYKTSVCPLARAVRTELKKRGVKSLKVVYSKEEPIKQTASASVAGGGSHRVPGSVSFVPSVAGLIIAGEVIKDIAFGRI